MVRIFFLFLFFLAFLWPARTDSCTVLFYQDPVSKRIFVANNEDFWYDVKPYIHIMPRSKTGLARIWYGWNRFAQGGINEAGLFFDGATTPKVLNRQMKKDSHGNLGDRLLAQAGNVQSALLFLEKEELVLDGAHMILGDSSGRAVVVEWISNRRLVYERTNSALVLANFLYSNPSAGNFPCPRTISIISNIGRFERKIEKADLLTVGNFIGQAVQLPVQDNSGRWGGTLYTTFIDYDSNTLILIPRLQNEKIIKLNLNEQFKSKKSERVRF